MTKKLSLQQQYAKNSICFGCGPANNKGLHINSYIEGDKVIAEFSPQPEHQAFEGAVSGGIVGVLMDCHCNWTACWALMQHQNLNTPPCTVTAEYCIQLKRPTPSDSILRLEAWVENISGHKAMTAGRIIANDKITATCQGTFVAVNESHPAYHRW
ncbi:MAG: PaaI family thioesterase [Coxiellaceae bacterium]|nr:PaaI family thioesterase [Coxiellaceae bacterium]